MSKRTVSIDPSNFPDREVERIAAAPIRSAGPSLVAAKRRADGKPPRILDPEFHPAERRVSVEVAWRRAQSAAAREIRSTVSDHRAKRAECAADILESALVGAHRETAGATLCPRAARVQIAYLRLEARNWVRREQRPSGWTSELPVHDDDGSPVLGSAFLIAGREATPGLPDWAALAVAERLAEWIVPTATEAQHAAVAALAYVALRDATGDECAAELDLNPDALRKRETRGRARIRAQHRTARLGDPPRVHPADRTPSLLEALGILDRAEAGTTRSAGKPDDKWRDSQPWQAPTAERIDRGLRARRARRADGSLALPLKLSGEALSAARKLAYRLALTDSERATLPTSESPKRAAERRAAETASAAERERERVERRRETAPPVAKWVPLMTEAEAEALALAARAAESAIAKRAAEPSAEKLLREAEKRADASLDRACASIHRCPAAKRRVRTERERDVKRQRYGLALAEWERTAPPRRPVR